MINGDNKYINALLLETDFLLYSYILPKKFQLL